MQNMGLGQKATNAPLTGCVLKWQTVLWPESMAILGYDTLISFDRCNSRNSAGKGEGEKEQLTTTLAEQHSGASAHSGMQGLF